MLHQYIRQQADALAQIRLSEYRQLQGWTDYELPQPVSLKDEPLRKGGGPHEGGAKQQQEPCCIIGQQTNVVVSNETNEDVRMYT